MLEKYWRLAAFGRRQGEIGAGVAILAVSVLAGSGAGHADEAGTAAQVPSWVKLVYVETVSSVPPKALPPRITSAEAAAKVPQAEPQTVAASAVGPASLDSDGEDDLTAVKGAGIPAPQFLQLRYQARRQLPGFGPGVPTRYGTAMAVAGFAAGSSPLTGPRKLVEELNCLALNIYFEARSEPQAGQRAVAHVVMNRVRDPRFPETVCDVVRQGGERVRHRCQFSWWCDGLSDRPRNLRLWRATKAVALEVYGGYSADPTDGALWYHADYVMPYWGRVFKRGPKIGRHIFYVADDKGIYLAANHTPTAADERPDGFTGSRSPL